ncbi:o-succinylbenzoate synthase [Microbacterium marinilacus]|uniref:o-succinylbenzoate synthase n=1 Tax=Microbacterium marinilacus TaxID=415209 RepID=A0ABP7BFF8_9MICO|nr:o-succinylbenzoate synthase [Microbacterium marinilacus]MBY0689564.1 o-succinylbenzoate synthase [Microbacterium marinilacus]
MKLRSLRLHHVELPLVAPFTTSFGTQTAKRCFLVEAQLETAAGELVTGWGENVALPDPVYSPEHVEGAAFVIERWLAPLLYAADDVTAETVGHLLRHIVGHQMAKASVEMAVIDAQLRAEGRSFASYLGAVSTTVPSGVSVGIQESIEATVGTVGGYIDQGYARIKLKIQPGADVAHVAAVRREFGDDLPFQVDANAAYTLVDAPHLHRLDEHGLLLIEQPLGEADIRQHAELAKLMRTPICLDESVVSAEAAADAISLGAAAVINIKPGRVGGYLEARRIHDLARAHGIAVWCGGMLETGIGRAANAALAALPGFTLPGDISGSDRFYSEDITTEPIRMHDGVVDVPTGPGFGVDVDPERLERFRTRLVDVAPTR